MIETAETSAGEGRRRPAIGAPGGFDLGEDSEPQD